MKLKDALAITVSAYGSPSKSVADILEAMEEEDIRNEFRELLDGLLQAEETRVY